MVGKAGKASKVSSRIILCVIYVKKHILGWEFKPSLPDKSRKVSEVIKYYETVHRLLFG